MPESPRRLLVVFGFPGLREYLRAPAAAADPGLLEGFGHILSQTIGEAGSLYEARRGEFFALLDAGLGSDRQLLTAASARLDRTGAPFGVRSSYAIVVLPDEAALPTAAVMAADDRLRASTGDLRPAPHGSLPRPHLVRGALSFARSVVWSRASSRTTLTTGSGPNAWIW